MPGGYCPRITWRQRERERDREKYRDAPAARVKDNETKAIHQLSGDSRTETTHGSPFIERHICMK